MFARWSLSAVVVFGLTSPACSGAGAEPLAGDFSGDPTATTTSETGELHVALYTLPAEAPVRGTNQVLLQVTPVGDSPEPELDVRLTTFMPAMGHGSGKEPKLVAIEAGRYTFENVVLNMPGLWELHVAVSGDIEDAIKFQFDVE